MPRRPRVHADETRHETHEHRLSETTHVFAWCTTCRPKQLVLRDWEGENFTPLLGLPHMHVMDDDRPV